ncbi:MAG: NAD(P)H-hydrate dehydratase [Bacteroidota bacterium]
MKIFKTEQVKEIDKYTIEKEPIASIDLMERASLAFVRWFMRTFDSSRKVVVFSGPGNNGGDGLAIARLLDKRFFNVDAYLLKLGSSFSEDLSINKERLEKSGAGFKVIEKEDALPELPEDIIIIDAIFGSGLSRKAEGLPAAAIRLINTSGADVVSVDIPSGLFGEDNSDNDPDLIVNADYTITFELPFLSFFFPENEKYCGKWHAYSIGLHPEAIKKTKTSYYLVDKDMVSGMVKERSRFAHKGTFGNALYIAGSDGMMGAAVLGIKACLRAGAGLATAHVPGKTYNIIQMAVPEALISIDPSDTIFTDIPDLEKYSAIGAGPGLGTLPKSSVALEKLLKNAGVPLVLDADALNLISANKELMNLIPRGSVITPHPKEFDRLFGGSDNMYQRHQKQLEEAEKYGIYIVLKYAHTMICDPEGTSWINHSGNPGMASGGSGDVLTGIILSFLAQGYEPGDSAILGVYLHGLAGDLALENQSYESLIPGDIIDYLGKAFKLIDPHTKS